MNCEKCNELLSDFIDGAIDDEDRGMLSSHLEECLRCFNVHAEMSSIVTYCQDHRGEYEAPPNENAMWLRIRNTIESGSATIAPVRTRPVTQQSWLSRTTSRSWEFSFPQMATAVVGIIILASLATVIGLRGLQNKSGTATAEMNNPGIRSALTSINGAAPKERLLQQQQINYLSTLVEQNKGHWNPQVRADFERNLNLLDDTVNESLQKLSVHPHDDVTEEMLDSALNDKMQLLREFSDL
jgi:hypothetical protein